MPRDDEGIDPIGCLIDGVLMIAVCGVLIKFAILVFKWAIR